MITSVIQWRNLYNYEICKDLIAKAYQLCEKEACILEAKVSGEKAEDDSEGKADDTDVDDTDAKDEALDAKTLASVDESFDAQTELKNLITKYKELKLREQKVKLENESLTTPTVKKCK